MTSTPFNVGLNDGARLSSRVLRPPGGGHTNIFDSEPEPPRTGRRAVPPSATSTFSHGQGDEPKATNGTSVATNGQSTPKESPEPQIQQEAPAAAERAPKADSPVRAAPEQPRAEAPKRVRVPPGGFSSGLW
ncbi:jupiter microtubule associated homolog 1-like [Bombyx mandarina]|uniref:Microtubule-associated protein Jupiter n=2 Tax=Bombyx TaxID=7090 RepID=A0A8R2LVA3_BOMMO|nr:jupiter microtubule associated homolog 1 [Bombyx mori]XP_028035647.1 jupiter microtubule associated homolog 1-like [Bombyx mandarina]XP_037867941.1 jupiter microtubule associated homolog 1 [Bombyx mori]